VLGPLLFIIHVNDVSLKIGHISEVIIFANATHVLVSKNNCDFKHVFNFVLLHICKWFNANQPFKCWKH
jgi:hypothetical protein